MITGTAAAVVVRAIINFNIIKIFGCLNVVIKMLRFAKNNNIHELHWLSLLVL